MHLCLFIRIHCGVNGHCDPERAAKHKDDSELHNVGMIFHYGFCGWPTGGVTGGGGSAQWFGGFGNVTFMTCMADNSVTKLRVVESGNEIGIVHIYPRYYPCLRINCYVHAMPFTRWNRSL